MENIILLMKKWFEEHSPKANNTLFKKIKNNKEYWNIILEYVKNLNINNSQQIFYHFYNQLNEIPKCEICGKDLKFKTFSLGYTKSCSKKCSTLKSWNNNVFNENIIKKRSETLKNKYLDESQNKIIIEKRKNTCLQKYNVEHSMKSPEIIEKRKKIFIEKYGVDNLSKLPEVKEKISNTWNFKTNDEKEKIIKYRYEKYLDSINKKYNVNNVFDIKNVREKIKQTNLEKYGVETPLASKDIRNKIKQTNLEKYGVENAMQNNDIQNKCFLNSVKFENIKLDINREIKIQGDLK